MKLFSTRTSGCTVDPPRILQTPHGGPDTFSRNTRHFKSESLRKDFFRPFIRIPAQRQSSIERAPCFVGFTAIVTNCSTLNIVAMAADEQVALRPKVLPGTAWSYSRQTGEMPRLLQEPNRTLDP
jgi:hypothetical protein